MKRLKHIILLAVVSCLPLFAISAQELAEPELMSADEAKVAATVITDNYAQWDKVSLSGKLKLESLPISPSVKIYMERGQRIVISLRAPFLGEVGTVEIDSSQFTIVNKMNRTYCRQSLTELMADLPVTLADLQDIFLARVFLPDYGTLSMDNYGEADFYLSNNPSGWILLPRRQPLEYDVSCGFTILPDGRTDSLVVTTLDGKNCATATYTYSDKRTEINLAIRHGGKDRDFLFTVNDIDFNGKSVKPATIDKNYRQLPLRDFFKKMM